MSKQTHSVVKPQLMVIQPLFQNHKPMRAVIGVVVTPEKAREFLLKPTAEAWEALFRSELLALLNVAMDRGQIDRPQFLELAERWLNPTAQMHLAEQPEDLLPMAFVDAVFEGGVEISPDSPFNLVKMYLRAKEEGDKETQTALAEQSEKLVSNEEMTHKMLMSFSPMERVDIILANLMR